MPYPIEGGVYRNPIDNPPASFNLPDVLYQQMQQYYGMQHMSEAEAAQLLPYFFNEMERLGVKAEDLFAADQGYTPDEQGRLRQAGNFSQFFETPGEFNDYYMRPDEMDQVRGDPFQALDWINPDSLQGYVDDARNEQVQALDQGRADVLGGIDPSWYQFGKDDVNVDPYTSRAMGAVGQDLKLSENFAEDYPMSDAEVTGQAELAGRTANMRYQSDLDEINRRARASGGTSSLAMGALGDRMRRQGAIAGADATARARLDALAQQREQVRMAEQMRLMAEQGYTDRQIQAAIQSGGLQIDAAGTRQRGGAMYGDAMQRGGVALMESRLGAARDAADRGIGVGQYVTDTGAGYTQRGEENLADRNRYLSSNRQETARYAGDTRFRRGMDIAGANYGVERDIAGEGVTGRRRYGDWATDQSNQNRQGFESQQTNRLKSATLYGGLRGDATGNFADAKRSGRLSGFTNALSGQFARALFNPTGG